MKIIRLSNKFYARAFIEEAAKDYKDILEIKFLDDFFTLELSEKQQMENLDKEFANYVLSLMQIKDV